MRANFTWCSEHFRENSRTLYSNYIYNGPIRGEPDRTVLITLKGCRDLCGTGSDFYSWKALLSRAAGPGPPHRRRLTVATALGILGHHHHLGPSHLGPYAPGSL